jgi:hypothetical protein
VLVLVANNVKINETRGIVFLKYNERDDFYNILMPKDTLLILVNFLPYFQSIIYVLGTLGPLPVHYTTMKRKL